MGLGLRRRLESAARSHPALRRALTMAQLARDGSPFGGPAPPIDREYGIQTQGPVPLYLTRTGSAADAHIVPYSGCVPSALRHALDGLPPLSAPTFLDLGCGKGRALVIASERAFSRIVGVELNPDIAQAARANARRVARRFPDRTPIEVRVGDASRPELPEGHVILFMYHPFGRALVARLCDHLAENLSPVRSLLVVYENPVYGDVFDLHPDFQRLYEAMTPCDGGEVGFAFDAEEAVVVWRSRPCGAEAKPAPVRPIVIVKDGFRAVLGPAA